MRLDAKYLTAMEDSVKAFTAQAEKITIAAAGNSKTGTVVLHVSRV